MTKRQNLLNLLNGEKFDYTPAGFWLHFPEDVIAAGVESQVNAHLDFLEKTDVDILKIMNENEFRRSEKINSIDDWSKIVELDENHDLFVKQEEINQQIVDKVGDDVFTLGTVHGVLASLSHSSGHSYSEFPEILMKHLEKDEEKVVQAIEAVYKNVEKMLEVTERTNVDGIYYALLGAEADRLPDDIFQKYIAPYDKKIMDKIKSYKFLHVCKERTDLVRIEDYNFDVLNWAVHENERSVAEGQELYKDKIIQGGLDDRSGVLVDGDKEEIVEFVQNLKSSVNLERFILGADCTLPTEINYERIRTAVEAAR